jgi:hypothetical protein
VKLAVPAAVRRWTTDPDQPLHQGPYRSPLRDERLAAYLGATLGVLFTVCFVTGLYSHLHQHPQSWLALPSRPAGLYRLTQGVHVAAGIASVPVLIAKLWLVWPRFVAFPPFRSASHFVERVGLFPLVAGGVFMTFSGVANIAQWYPWRFSFTATHFWMAWVTMGAIVAHVGAKWVVTRRALTRPSRRPALSEADPVLETVAEPPRGTAPGLSRRGFLGTVAAASGVLTVTTAGQTLPPLAVVGAPRAPGPGAGTAGLPGQPGGTERPGGRAGPLPRLPPPGGRTGGHAPEP